MMTAITFGIGMMVGACGGVLLVALATMARRSQRDEVGHDD
jgi:hypothetical protein